MSNYRVNYILDIMVHTIRYKRMLKFNSSALLCSMPGCATVMIMMMPIGKH